MLTNLVPRCVLPTLGLLLLGALSGCGGKDAEGGKSAAGAPAGASQGATEKGFTADDAAEAKKTFETICFTCHGMAGKGDGPGSAALDPKPRDLSLAEWQKTVTDDHIRNVITMGGSAVGKSPMMPAQPQLKGTPKVLDALVAHVRSLAR